MGYDMMEGGMERKSEEEAVRRSKKKFPMQKEGGRAQSMERNKARRK